MTRWFGDPWPAEGSRAPVCENEADRVPTPVGEPCLFCARPIADGDQGLVIPYVGNNGPTVSPVHLLCLIGQVATGEALQQAANAVRADWDLPPLPPPNPITGYQRPDTPGT